MESGYASIAYFVEHHRSMLDNSRKHRALQTKIARLDQELNDLNARGAAETKRTKAEEMSALRYALDQSDKALLENKPMPKRPLEHWLRSTSISLPGHSMPRRLGSYPTLPGALNGRKVAPLADLGASHNYVSQAFVRRHGYPIAKEESNNVQLANSKRMAVVGTTTMSFTFKGDSQPYELPFKVLRNCVHDIILGGPFLHLTETFTRFMNRIRWKAGGILHPRVNFLDCEGHQQYMRGWLDGNPIDAMPDTGSQVMLVSERYAMQNSLKVCRGDEYRIQLQLADGSTTFTEGVLKDMEWKYDEHGVPHRADFYVLKDLACDVILSCGFLVETRAFDSYAYSTWDHPIEDIETEHAALYVIVNVSEIVQRAKSSLTRRLRGPKTETVSTAGNTWMLEYEKESQVLMQRRERLDHLPTNQYGPALVAWDAEWKKLQVKYNRLPHNSQCAPSS